MKFVLTLNEPYNETKHKTLSELGYNLTYVTKLKPELIFVENEKGKIEELQELSFVLKARKERVFTLGI